MYNILYYRPAGFSRDADTPTDVFLKELEKKNLKLYEKTLRSMWLLETHGRALKMPYSKFLKDGIFELRTEFGGNITRLLYFFDEGKVVVVTHGFVKKSQKTPPSEIEYAIRAKKNYFETKGKEEGNG